MASFGIRRAKSGSGSLPNAKFFYYTLHFHCRSVTRSYYRGAAGAILVYDITKSVVIVSKATSINGTYVAVESRS